MQRVFVYGTLKNGQYFHDRYLGGDKSTFLGKAYASNEYSLYVGAQPHLIKDIHQDDPDYHVKGELYVVTPEVLESLDQLEGHPVVYKRELIDVEHDGKPLLAWAYLRPPHFEGKSRCYKETEFI